MAWRFSFTFYFLPGSRSGLGTQQIHYLFRFCIFNEGFSFLLFLNTTPIIFILLVVYGFELHLNGIPVS